MISAYGDMFRRNRDGVSFTGRSKVYKDEVALAHWVGAHPVFGTRHFFSWDEAMEHASKRCTITHPGWLVSREEVVDYATKNGC